MCILKNELANTIEDIRKYKALEEEARNIRTSLERVVIEYLEENKLSEEYIDNAKITYKKQSRTTLNRDELLKALGGDLKPYEKTTVYGVLRIN